MVDVTSNADGKAMAKEMWDRIIALPVAERWFMFTNIFEMTQHPEDKKQISRMKARAKRLEKIEDENLRYRRVMKWANQSGMLAFLYGEKFEQQA